MIILSLDRIIAYLEYFNVSVDISFLLPYEQAVLLVLGNILWFVILLLCFFLLYKILSRLVNALF